MLFVSFIACYSDICIGAPYEDDGRGALYLYSGSALTTNGNGAAKQRIQPEGLMSFGFSLTTVPDYYNNGCNGIRFKMTFATLGFTV